ncbi:MAG TPA: hypothetical protein VMV89_00930 [Candidatus Paceibacterota bacterium]|nr:hypothetical protein [Candidatus Paceibacterota bacterium]
MSRHAALKMSHESLEVKRKDCNGPGNGCGAVNRPWQACEDRLPRRLIHWHHAYLGWRVEFDYLNWQPTVHLKQHFYMATPGFVKKYLS